MLGTRAIRCLSGRAARSAKTVISTSEGRSAGPRHGSGVVSWDIPRQYREPKEQLHPAAAADVERFATGGATAVIAEA
jgi:hypothetical protein